MRTIKEWMSFIILATIMMLFFIWCFVENICLYVIKQIIYLIYNTIYWVFQNIFINEWFDNLIYNNLKYWTKIYVEVLYKIDPYNNPDWKE